MNRTLTQTLMLHLLAVQYKLEGYLEILGRDSKGGEEVRALLEQNQALMKRLI